MKRMLALAAALLMLCGCALADWTCKDPNCASTWPDNYDICDECGAEAPLHGLRVVLPGASFLRVKWEGCMTQTVQLYVAPAGTGAWDLAAEVYGSKNASLEGLQPGTAYDIMLMTEDTETILQITAQTVGTAAAAEPAAAPVVKPAAVSVAVPAASPAEAPAGQPAPTAYEAGSIIQLGRYHQTAAGDDSTPVEWQVLQVEGNRALVISRCGLDAQPYHTSLAYATWQTCTLRAWLNDTFLNAAFTPEEQAFILMTDVDNGNAQGNAAWSIPGGEQTQDRLFLLSCAEAGRYFGATAGGSNTDARLQPTAYALAAGASAISSYVTADGAAAGAWWLRSPGDHRSSAASVSAAGSLFTNDVNQRFCCVRPAMWIDLGLLPR